jgi:hypothetical protein
MSRKTVVAVDERGERHNKAAAFKEPPFPCKECRTLNRVDYDGWYCGNDDDTRECLSEFYCGACGAENLSRQPYPWGFSKCGIGGRV